MKDSKYLPKKLLICLEWSKGDASQANFSTKLMQHLRNCLPPVNVTLKREVMWCNFHTLRTSKDHFLLWNHFLKGSIQTGFDPIFFQYVTDHLFRQLTSSTSKSREVVDKVETRGEMRLGMLQGMYREI